MAELKVFSAISSINALLREGRSVPLSGLVMVNKQRMEQLLDDLENALDPDLDRAEKLLARERELLERIESQRVETETKAANEARTLVDDANKTAQKTVSAAQKEADKTLQDARAAAEEAVRQAAEQAQQIVANAQNHANRLIADAQASAAQLVSEDNITLTAKKYAEDIQNAAQDECDRLNNETLGNLHRMLEHADISLATQLDALRTLRQQLGVTFQDDSLPEYDESGYPEDGYSE